MINNKVSAPIEDRKALTELVRSLNKIESVCIEIGSFAGATANAMLIGGAKHIYCIDTWDGGPKNPDDVEDFSWKFDEEYGRDILHQFCNNTPIFTKVTPVIGKSKWWADHWPFKVDLIFIDANHDYEHICLDISSWWDKLKINGIMCGHDYGEYFPGVKKAVQEFSERHNLPYTISGRSIWSINKTHYIH